MAEPVLRKSDESAYTIVPSRVSTKLSCRNSHTSDESDEMVYRHLSFEDDLFTARVYKRNYRNFKIRSMFAVHHRGNEMKGKDILPRKASSLQTEYGEVAMASGFSSSSSDQCSLVSGISCDERPRRGPFFEFRSPTMFKTKDPQTIVKESSEPIRNAGPDGQGMTQDMHSQGWRAREKEQEEREWEALVHTIRANKISGLGIWSPSHSTSAQRFESLAALPLQDESRSVMQSGHGMQPLHLAIRMNCPDVVKTLLHAGADINCIDDSGNQPVHAASRFIDNPELMHILIGEGADIEAEDLFGDKPLALSCRYGHLGDVQTLLGFDATVSSSLLRKAVSSLHDAIVRELLNHGADTEARCPRTGRTPLLVLAAKTALREREFPAESNIIRLLHLSGANFKAQDHKGNSFLHLLAKRQWSEMSIDKALHVEDMIRYAIDYGANVNAANAQRETPLLLAARNLNVRLYELFMEMGAHSLTEPEIVRLKLDLATGRPQLDLNQMRKSKHQNPVARNIRARQLLQLFQ